MAKYRILYENGFVRDLKLCVKRGCRMERLEAIVALLADGEPLPVANRDHALTGQWKGFRECHITPDWLLVYTVEEERLILTLTRTGTHSDLF